MLCDKHTHISAHSAAPPDPAGRRPWSTVGQEVRENVWNNSVMQSSRENDTLDLVKATKQGLVNTYINFMQSQNGECLMNVKVITFPIPEKKRHLTEHTS